MGTLAPSQVRLVRDDSSLHAAEGECCDGVPCRLRGIFRYYCISGSVGSNNPWTMGMRQYENFVKAAKLKVRAVRDATGGQQGLIG